MEIKVNVKRMENDCKDKFISITIVCMHLSIQIYFAME